MPVMTTVCLGSGANICEGKFKFINIVGLRSAKRDSIPGSRKQEADALARRHQGPPKAKLSKILRRLSFSIPKRVYETLCANNLGKKSIFVYSL